jgi:hypothetical protein
MCFCHDNRRYKYHDLIKHLIFECEEVMMHCQFCHSDCNHGNTAKLGVTAIHDDCLNTYTHKHHGEDEHDTSHPHAGTWMTRRALRSHKCYVETRDLDHKFATDANWRIRTIASMYEKANLSCSLCH